MYRHTSFQFITKNTQMASEYDDYYIYNFFTTYYSKFPIELKIRILSQLSIAKIILFKSFINDNETKGLQIKSITTQKIHDFRCDFCGNNPKGNSISDIIKLVKNTDNIIPIVVHFEERTYQERPKNFSFNHLKYGLQNNADFELMYHHLYYFKCMNLRKFPYKDKVSSISISRLKGDETVMELDLSAFTELKKFRLISNNNILKLKLSPKLFENVTDLAIDNIFDSEFYSKFIYLRNFEIYIQKGRDIEIKLIPRGVITLKIVAECGNVAKHTSGGQVIVNSKEDWPPNLRHLTLGDSYNTDGVFNNAICYSPPYLTTLIILGYPINEILSQIPITITDLDLTFAFTLASPASGVKSELHFPPCLQNLTLFGLVLETIDEVYNVPRGVTSFRLVACEFSTSSIDFNFDNCKSSLEWLLFDHCLEFFAFANVDYSDFSKLNEIKFSNCGVSSLTNFIPPSCLSSLKISNNPITFIDESCPLFNNEKGYPLLKSIWIEHCQISFISPNIELPLNLNDLIIADDTTKVFYFNSSIARHVSLKHLYLSKLCGFQFCDDVEVSSKESNFWWMELNVTDDFFPTHDALNIFYDKLELYFGRTLRYRDQNPTSGIQCYSFKNNSGN
ncbi:hypothetical protein DFJ63DRAFT_310387 [Scheffersomyces coipomensis]|uniref:uncharacterized protein n=1 Tax=Scheffersomyces coipomensis TaxID=1788519 RepID=UPI00315DE390